MIQMILGVMLLAESVIDIKSKKVLLWMPFLTGSLGLLYQIYSRQVKLPEMGMVFAILFFMALISKITKEAIGMGDVWVIGSIFMVLGFPEGAECIFFAFVFAGLYSGILLSVKKRGRKKTFPFIPFLFLGFIGGTYI